MIVYSFDELLTGAFHIITFPHSAVDEHYQIDGGQDSRENSYRRRITLNCVSLFVELLLNTQLFEVTSTMEN